MSKSSETAHEFLKKKLANSEERLRLLIDNVKDHAIFMVDPAGIIITWNKGASKIFGYENDEVLNTNFDKIYPEPNKALASKHLKTAQEAGFYEEESWLLRKTGRFWADCIINSIVEEDVLLGFSIIARDLSKQKTASQNEQIFQLLVSSVKDYAIFMLDPSGHVLTWNEGAQRIKGYDSSEIIGKHFSTFYLPEAIARKHPAYELEVAQREGHYQEEGWRLRKDGTQFFASVTITAVVQDGKLIGFAKVTRDLTERKKAESQEEIFKLLVSGVRDYAIFMLDPDGNIITWNEGAERIKGYKAEEAIGKHFSVFYTKEAQKRRHPEKELQIARAEGRYEEEGWRVRKDGSLLWANVVITAIKSEGKLIGFAKVTRDLTQKLLADQERDASAKLLDETNSDLRLALEVKSRFLSTLSHEVRTPMTAIIGLTELLRTEELGEDNNSVVASIYDSSKRLLQLLNNMLESARMESGQLTLQHEKFPVRVAVGDIRQLVARDAKAKNLRITGDCAADVPELVWGDEIKLRQALLNLIHNAVKFTEKGEVDLSATVVEKTNDSVTLRFSVSDTGIGIAPIHHDKLFQPFSQVRDTTKKVYGGSGLGLSITKAIIELMGGTISYESQENKGSRFWFEVPFVTESAK